MRSGGHGDQLNVLDARQRGGVGDAWPQLERAFGQVGLLAIGVHAPGGSGGLHHRRQRGRLVARRGVVVCDARRQLGLVVAVLARLALERARQSQVELGTLARQQIVVERLAQQRMTEDEAVVLVGDQHLL